MKRYLLYASVIGGSILGLSTIIYSYFYNYNKEENKKKKGKKEEQDINISSIKEQIKDLLKINIENKFCISLPIGSVIMWNGSVDSIPVGWEICDGKNGTPNMINRFVMGSMVSGNKGDKELKAITTTSSKHKHLFEYQKIHFLTDVFGAGKTKKDGIRFIKLIESDGHNHEIINTTELKPDYVTMIFIIKVS